MLVAPVDSVDGAPTGNRVTAERWCKLYGELGHRVRVARDLDGDPFDVLVALHASKSAEAIARAHAEDPRRPIVVGLAGTDIYADEFEPETARSLGLATLIVALQPAVARQLDDERVRIVLQSVEVPRGLAGPAPGSFDVCQLGHLRAVKDPLRAAEAARSLGAESRLRVLHIGRALEPAWAIAARAEERENPRYTWLGERPRDEALRILARCRLHVSTSFSEGGANALSEAIALGVPTIATRIDGTLGILGDDWPATFEVGDTRALTDLLERVETDPAFLADLKMRTRRLAPLVAPARELATWRALFDELHEPDNAGCGGVVL